MTKSKGIVTIDQERCKGCGLCAAACPVGMLAMDGSSINTKGYRPAVVNEMEHCLGCGYCALVCPDVAIEVERILEREKAYV